MSPSRTATFQRWQVFAAFVAVTAAFVVATVIATNASGTAHRTAVQGRSLALQARALALQNRRTLEREDRIRAELVRKIHRQDVVSCRRTRLANHVLRDGIKRNVRQTRLTLLGPTADLPGVRDLLTKSLQESARLLRKLQAADCPGVPPLAPPPKLGAAP